ncbi:MAG: aminotransferase class IV [Kofleriaceae bacterium]
MVVVSIDGALVKPEAARISVFDRGLLYGDGCFEVLRTWNGVARDLDAHLDRLFETARFLVMKTIERTKLVEAVYRCIAAAGETGERPGAPQIERRIRIVLTRGPGSIATPLAELGQGHAIVIVEPLPPQPIELTLAIVDWPVAKGHGEGRKTLAYLDRVYAYELARAAGADEAVRLDHRGNVVEGATCNVFVVSGSTVATPPTEDGALPGIVRARVLQLLDREKLTGAVRVVSARDLRGADEIFVTSSLRGVVAITRLDGVPRAAGPLTARIAQAYVDAMRA